MRKHTPSEKFPRPSISKNMPQGGRPHKRKWWLSKTSRRYWRVVLRQHSPPCREHTLAQLLLPPLASCLLLDRNPPKGRVHGQETHRFGWIQSDNNSGVCRFVHARKPRMSPIFVRSKNNPRPKRLLPRSGLLTTEGIVRKNIPKYPFNRKPDSPLVDGPSFFSSLSSLVESQRTRWVSERRLYPGGTFHASFPRRCCSSSSAHTTPHHTTPSKRSHTHHHVGIGNNLRSSGLEFWF